MKRIVFVLFFFFFVLLACRVWAGQTSLVTYYSAPTAAYNKIKILTSSGPSGAPTCSDASGSPIAANVGALFVDTTTGNLAVCDKDGTTKTYPLQCYNSFCSYVTSSGTPCNPSCTSGYSPLESTAGTLVRDSFVTDATYTVISDVCCIGGPLDTRGYSVAPRLLGSCTGVAASCACTSAGPHTHVVTKVTCSFSTCLALSTKITAVSSVAVFPLVTNTLTDASGNLIPAGEGCQNPGEPSQACLANLYH